MSTQLQRWSTEFGREYTNRNVIDWHTRLPAFRTMLSGLPIQRALEVGCNRGHNLLALSELLGEQGEVVGVEPNAYAVEIARQSSSKVAVLRGNITELPFRTGYFDLVFTVGVLIHVPLESLQAAILELARASSRYLLAAEYFAEQETTISYRGSNELLWKRNFPGYFQGLLPGINLSRSGYLAPEEGFDRVHWWLFEQQKSEP
jgi:pseudaminic acid biosynthesis-associated methylase